MEFVMQNYWKLTIRQGSPHRSINNSGATTVCRCHCNVVQCIALEFINSVVKATIMHMINVLIYDIVRYCNIICRSSTCWMIVSAE